MEKFYILPLVLMLLIGVYEADAQDVHLTQYDHSFRIINPALTGLFNGDHRIEGNFRRQWKGVPVDYITFSGSYDGNVQPQKSDNSLFGRSEEQRLNSSHVAISYAVFCLKKKK